MDLNLFQVVHSLAGQLKFLDWLAIFLAKYLPYVLVLGALVFALKQSFWKTRVFVFTFIALNVILSRGIFTEVIRFVYERRRPFEVLDFTPLVPNGGPSFPSGHAAMFFALALAILYLHKKLGWWYLVSAFVVSLARVFAGVHWPSDILGGFVVASLSFWLIKNLLQPFSPKITEE